MCDRLSQLDILATTPPVIYANTFDGVKRTIPVNVPKGCGEAYRNAPYWSEFTNINEDWVSETSSLQLPFFTQ